MSKVFQLLAIIFTSVTACVCSARSQPSTRLGVYASIGTTTNKSPFGYGLGTNFVATRKLSDELAAFGSIGYTRLFTKDTSPIPDYEFVPVKLGIKVFPVITSLYATTTVGAGLGLRKGGKTSFIFGGGFGYEWGKCYDITLNYEGYSQRRSSTTYHPFNGQFALTFGYYF